MKREKRKPKPGLCLFSAVVWVLMAVVWGREAMVWQNAFRLGLVEASGVWLRWGLAALSVCLAAAWCVYWIKGRRQCREDPGAAGAPKEKDGELE